jgi:hypothetical protein
MAHDQLILLVAKRCRGQLLNSILLHRWPRILEVSCWKLDGHTQLLYAYNKLAFVTLKIHHVHKVT